MERREESLKSVMVVDDEEMVRDTLTGLLAVSGYHVIQAKDWLDGLFKYQTLRPNISLVVIVIKMPMMDGIILCNAIKDADPNTKIILISDYAEQPQLEAKSDVFFPKPFKGKDFLDVVKQIQGN